MILLCQLYASRERALESGRALLVIIINLFLQDAQDPSDETTTTNEIEPTHGEEEEEKFFGKNYQDNPL